MSNERSDSSVIADQGCFHCILFLFSRSTGSLLGSRVKFPEWVGRVILESSLGWTGSFEILAKTLKKLLGIPWDLFSEYKIISGYWQLMHETCSLILTRFFASQIGEICIHGNISVLCSKLRWDTGCHEPCVGMA